MQCPQLTQADSTALGAHVGTLGDGYAVMPNTHTHTLTQACAQTGRPQLSPRLSPLPRLTHTGPHRQMHMVLHGHTDLHTHTSSPPSISLGWGQLCNPYGAQTQLGCPGVCLWGGAGASVPGDSPSASICSPPSEDSYHTPQGGLASQHLAQDLYRSCWLQAPLLPG